MGLITVIFLLVFTLLYISKSLEKKPAPLTQFVNVVTPHISQIAFAGVIYGVIAAALTILMPYTAGGLFIRLLANFLIVMMAMPYALDKLMAKFQEQLNPAINQEIKNFAGWVTRNEKYIGAVGGVVSLLLIFMVFK